MTLRATITFEGFARCAVDRRTMVGLDGTRHVAVAGPAVSGDGLTINDVARAEDVARYLSRLTGLAVRIETETVDA